MYQNSLFLHWRGGGVPLHDIIFRGGGGGVKGIMIKHDEGVGGAVKNAQK